MQGSGKDREGRLDGKYRSVGENKGSSYPSQLIPLILYLIKSVCLIHPFLHQPLQEII
jgi:hypothetical protein